MKKKRILILSAGGPAGISCIKALREVKGVEIVAADKSPYAAGFQFTSISHVIPDSKEEGFLPAIEDLIHRHKVDVLIPSFETGIKKLSELMTRFGLDGKNALLCQDKLAFGEKCKEIGLPIPKTEILSKKFNGKFPKYAKPRCGSGSRNHFVIHSKEELGAVLKIKPDEDYLIQDYLTGPHWNIDVLVDNGVFLMAIPRRDILQQNGESMTVEVKDYDVLIQFSKEVQKRLGITSMFNLEVFEVSPGSFVINEINVRFGGGIIFSVLAGVNMVAYLATKDTQYLSTIKEGVYTRFLEEISLPDIKTLR